MDPEKNLPRMADESRIAKLAVNAVEDKFLRAAGYELEKIEEGSDYGRDLRVIFKTEGLARGFSTSLQVKGTESIDTDTHRGFGFELKVRTIQFLEESEGPSYLLVHNVESGHTYFREVNELASFLDTCRPGWREQKTVSFTVQAQNLLDDAKIKEMCEEAAAWKHHRKTLDETVVFLEEKLERFADIQTEKTEHPEGAFLRAKLSGKFRLVSVPATVDLLMFMSNLTHGMALCNLFRSRIEKNLYPHEIADTHYGPLNLTDLTARLEEVKERHLELAARLGDVIRSAELQPREDAEWEPPAETGLLRPKCDDLSAEEAADRLTEHFERLGLSVERMPDSNTDLLVGHKATRGICSLSVFDRRVERARVEQVREDLAAVDGCAAVVLIKYCQFEKLGLHTWPRPDVEPSPAIPVGTISPLAESFESELLVHVSEADAWGDIAITAARRPGGRSLSMPDWAQPDSDQAREYQGLAVRRFVSEALDSVQRGVPWHFSFIWIDQRVEVFTFTSPADLLTMTLVGPGRFEELGGAFMCTYAMREPE